MASPNPLVGLVKDVVVDVENGTVPSQILGLLGVPNALGSLAVLNGVDKVAINTFEDGGALGWEAETQVKYNVLNGRGEQMFYGGEYAEGCSRGCYAWNRPYSAYLFDQDRKVVVVMKRDCTACLTLCGAKIAGSEVRVTSRTGEFYGKLSQKISCCKPTYVISDKKGKDLMLIKGPTCTCCVGPRCGNKLFTISLIPGRTLNEVLVPGQCQGHGHGQGQGQGQGRGQDEDEDDNNMNSGPIIVGSIFKKNSEDDQMFGQFGSGESSFGIQLEPNLDPKMKALVIGAAFDIDISHFQEPRCVTPCSIGFALYVIVVTAITMILTIVVFNMINKSKG